MERPETSKRNRENNEKVIEGNAKVKKRSASRKMLGALIPEDAVDLKEYVFEEVIVPIIQNGLYDIAVGWLGVLFGRGRSPSYSGRRMDSRPSYRDYYETRGSGERRRNDYRPSYTRREPPRRGAFDYDTIQFENFTEADKVLNRMRDQIATYGNVSVLEYFDFAGLTCEYTAKDFGWINLDRAKVVWDRDGWIIDGLPRALPIE